MAFTSLGKAPAAPQSNPRWHGRLLEAAEAAICLAWTRLKDRSDAAICAKDEDKITNALLKELRVIRKNRDIARFIPEIFGMPTRDSKVESAAVTQLIRCLISPFIPPIPVKWWRMKRRMHCSTSAKCLISNVTSTGTEKKASTGFSTAGTPGPCHTRGW